jgi:hypothetical protein
LGIINDTVDENYLPKYDSKGYFKTCFYSSISNKVTYYLERGKDMPVCKKA